MSGPCGPLSGLYSKLARKKSLSQLSDDTSLHRCLGVCDLVFMGVGGMVGSGIYVLVGIAAKEQAGPAIVLSFVTAAITIFLAAWCFTELAAQVPKTGSVYLFTYITLGEFMAFIIGWACLFGGINGVATNGRAWSAYLDALLGNRITNLTETYIANWTLGEPIAPYPDFVAAGVILVVTVIVAAGVQCSAKITAIFGCVNVGILMFASIVGFVYADVDNWTSPDTGGFFPFGWQGVFSGAGACFWAFTGFEVISISVEETKNPKRAIPISMMIALIGVLILYLSTAASITLVTSYTEIDSEAPLPSAFAHRGILWAQYIVSVGPLFGLSTTLVTGIYGYVRMAYAMAEDGLIFRVFSDVNPKTKVPVISTLVGGLLMAIQALFLDLKNIVSFGVVLSLLLYILVDFCVIVLRYRPSEKPTEMYTQRKLSTTNLYDIDVPNGDSLQSPLNWKINKFRETSLNNGHTNSGSLTNLLLEDSGSVASDDITNTELTRDGKTHNEYNHDGKTHNEYNHEGKTHSEYNHIAINNDTKNHVGNNASSDIKQNTVSAVNPESMNLVSDDVTRDSVTSDILDHLESISQQSEEFHNIPLTPDGSVGKLKPSFSCLRCLSNIPAGNCVFTTTVLGVVAMCVLSLVVTYGNGVIGDGVWWAVVIVCCLLATIVVLQVIIVAHKQNLQDLAVKVPCIPWIPSLSIFTCTILMFSTATVTSWVGIIIVFVIGVVMYFSYSLSHSKLTATDRSNNNVTVQEILGDRVALLRDTDSAEDEF